MPSGGAAALEEKTKVSALATVRTGVCVVSDCPAAASVAWAVMTTVPPGIAKFETPAIVPEPNVSSNCPVFLVQAAVTA
jgi:hypothetical protein